MRSNLAVEPAAAASHSAAFSIWKAFVIFIFFVFMAGFVLLLVIDSLPEKWFAPPKVDDYERVMPGAYGPENEE